MNKPQTNQEWAEWSAKFMGYVSIHNGWNINGVWVRPEAWNPLKEKNVGQCIDCVNKSNFGIQILGLEDGSNEWLVSLSKGSVIIVNTPNSSLNRAILNALWEAEEQL